MADQAALQEAIQRARQLAAKISQTAPVKRPASDDSVGTVKVTLAYEKKPARDQQNSSANNQSKDNYSRENNNRDNYTRDNYTRDNNNRDNHNRDNHTRDNHNRDNYSRDSYTRDNNQSNVGSNLPSEKLLNSSEDKIEMIIPHAVIGLVIGKAGENIKRIQSETGATVRVDPTSVDEKGNKVCTITGSKSAVEDAHSQVANVIENASSNKRPRLHVEGIEYRMKIPASRTGAIIGKGGEKIKSIKQQSGCDIELDKNAKECGPEESVFIIRGTQDKINKARSLIEARLASRGRDSDHHSGHHRSSSKGVATGANAAPVGQFTDLPTPSYSGSADASAAWAAYYAQYSSLLNQAGAQPATAPGALPYMAQGLAGTPNSQQVPLPDTQSQPQVQQASQPSQSQQTQIGANSGAQPQQDYSDQWIEYYLMNGRPDYAEAIIEMKKKQQQP